MSMGADISTAGTVTAFPSVFEPLEHEVAAGIQAGTAGFGDNGNGASNDANAIAG
jgi:hypothetical protein